MSLKCYNICDKWEIQSCALFILLKLLRYCTFWQPFKLIGYEEQPENTENNEFAASRHFDNIVWWLDSRNVSVKMSWWCLCWVWQQNVRRAERFALNECRVCTRIFSKTGAIKYITVTQMELDHEPKYGIRFFHGFFAAMWKSWLDEPF